MENADVDAVIRGEYQIKPLNVIKQILMMFISADTSGELRSHSGIVDYLLNKKSANFPDKIKIYLYSNASPTKRMFGYSRVLDVGDSKVKIWSEINFQPFGYFLTYDSPPPNIYMTDITGFKNFSYDEVKKVIVPTIYLKVTTPELGYYENVPR